MILSTGSKVMIVHRRLFEEDHPRYFLGEVDAYESGIVKVTGNTFVYDVVDGQFDKKADSRTKIFSLASGSVFCYELPQEVKVESLVFTRSGKNLVLTDNLKFRMDLSESYRAPVKIGSLKK